MALIRTDALTMRYGGEVLALDDLTCSLDPGVIGLVGANGSGKSTLIRILLGLLTPTDGTANVLDHDVATQGLAVREQVGYMPEHDCLPPDASATNFVVHMARMSGLPASEAREQAAETLRHVGLFEERYRHIRGYSTGMKQRVKLAQALVHGPSLLFLDEPTNGLDPGGRDDMLDLIERTGRAFGVSILMSSHLLGEIERVCDYIVLIDAGRIVRSGPLTDLTAVTTVLTVEVEWGGAELCAALVERGLDARADGRRIAVELGADTDGAAHQAIIDAVATLDLPLLRLEPQRRSLEDLFRPGAAEEDDVAAAS